MFQPCNGPLESFFLFHLKVSQNTMTFAGFATLLSPYSYTSFTMFFFSCWWLGGQAYTDIIAPMCNGKIVFKMHHGLVQWGYSQMDAHTDSLLAKNQV